jgi:hypothetical protein
VTVTPIREGITPGDPILGQMTDVIGETYELMSDKPDGKPVAMIVTMVSANGGALTRWYVADTHDRQTSLYLARAQQIMQIDLHEHQNCINHRD